MSFLPIVGRELRVASRRPASYWARCASVGTAIAFGAFIYVQAMSGPPATLGQALFYAISLFAFLYCISAGMRYTADCLSEEKREGTLGLLFLTDLKGYDVVAGKLVATSLNGFYGLVAIVPVLAIPLMMGGVARSELLRMTIVLLNTFFLSLAAGMFMSSICTSARKSGAGMFLLLVVIPIAMAWIQNTSETVSKTKWLQFLFAVLNPVTSAVLVTNPGAVPNASGIYWASVATMHVLAWVFLIAACIIVPRSWKDKSSARGRWGFRPGNWISGGNESGGSRRLFRRQLLDVNAFFWLCARQRFRPVMVWVALVVMAGFWIWGLLDNGSYWIGAENFFLTVVTINTILKVWIASEGGWRLGEDRKSGALELLLSTPMSIPDILRGQMLAMKRHFLAPMLTVMAVEAIYLLYILRNKGFGDSDMPETLAFGAAMILFLAADALALTAVAMWASLTAANPNRAMGIAVRRVLFLPVVIAVVPLYLYMILVVFMTRGTISWQVWVSVYFLSGLAADLYFGGMAWWRLQTQFREVATRRFTRKASFWKRMSGRGAPAGI